jgi:hypothetical protein
MRAGGLTDGQVDKQTDTTKIRAAFRKFANTPNNDNTKIYSRCLY